MFWVSRCRRLDIPFDTFFICGDSESQPFGELDRV